MARVLFMTLLTALVDLVAVLAFAAFIVTGHVHKAMLIAIAGAAWHALFAPTKEEREALAEFIAQIKRG